MSACGSNLSCDAIFSQPSSSKHRRLAPYCDFDILHGLGFGMVALIPRSYGGGIFGGVRLRILQ